MPLIEERGRKTIQDTLAEMVSPVKLVNFTQELECQYCRETRQLMEELASLSDKLSLEVFDFQSDKDTAAKYGIDKIPATVVESVKDHGIRFYGIPAGYEFATLLEDVLAVSNGNSRLADKTREKLQTVTRPIHIQVFVTPT